MAKFRHEFAALTLQDANGVWAQFTPQTEIAKDGREVKFGILETDDADQIKRLRAVGKADPDLTEVK